MQESKLLILFIASSLLISVIVILALIFLFSYQKKMVRQKMQIHQVKLDLQQKLLAASINAQEKERKRIASDLHDDIGSLLSAIKLNVKHLKTVNEVGDSEKQFLENTALMLDGGLERIRTISYNLLPPTLVRFGLWEALKELINDINQSKQIQIKVDFANMDGHQLAETAQLSIFRVFQELISNTMHHSGATGVQIRIRKKDQLEFEYLDDGKGITDDLQLQGLGIINMQSRIRAVGGTISFPEVNALPFRVNFSIPLN